ncbi:MAG: dipeptide/oligopeptide/nickel ABC transporter permease/ATP-binding protein, partial [Acidimicrobiia bacterium]
IPGWWGPVRRRRFGLAGAVLLAVIVGLALAAPMVAPYDPTERAGRPFSTPGTAHLLGTNDAGQDLFSELIHGARISLLVGVSAAVLATVIGAVVGLVSGYAGRWVDRVLMGVVDVMLALPILPLAIVLGVFAGPGLTTQLTAITVAIWAGPARELRAQVRTVRERDHVAAARAMGAGAAYALGRHIGPAVVPIVVSQFVLAAKTAILLESSLAFLGLGDAAAKSWGTTLFFANARSAFLTDAWLWWVVPPGLAIALTVVAFALIGFALEERSRPGLRPPSRPGVAPLLVSPPPPGSGDPLVIENLSVVYDSPLGPVPAVEAVSLSVAAGEAFGLVGESGSGKSTVAGAAAALLPPAARMTGGRVVVAGTDLGRLTPGRLRELRGNRIALIPQEAMSALNPVMTVGDQIAEAVSAHRRVARGVAAARARELLTAVGVDAGRAGAFPHQFSGGMRQRVVIAIALANDPAVVVADEPTTGLDLIVQLEILALLDELRRERSLALLIVSHDVAVIEYLAGRVAVMRAGRMVDTAPAGTRAP